MARSKRKGDANTLDKFSNTHSSHKAKGLSRLRDGSPSVTQVARGRTPHKLRPVVYHG